MNKILSFLNLLDYEGNLSITNLAVYIALVKMIFIPGGSLEDAGILFTALSSYAYKKHLVSKTVNAESSKNIELETVLDELNKRIEKTESKTNALSLKSGMNF